MIFGGEGRAYCEKYLSEIEQLLAECNQPNGKDKIKELLNRFSEIHPHVKYKEVRDSWLEDRTLQENYLDFVQSAFALEDIRQYFKKILDGRIKEDRNNTFNFKNNIDFIKKILQEGIREDRKSQEFNEFVIKKKQQSDSFDVESMGKFKF